MLQTRSLWWILKECYAMLTYHYMQYVSLVSLYLAVIVTTSLSMELMEHNQSLEKVGLYHFCCKHLSMLLFMMEFSASQCELLKISHK